MDLYGLVRCAKRLQPCNHLPRRTNGSNDALGDFESRASTSSATLHANADIFSIVKDMRFRRVSPCLKGLAPGTLSCLVLLPMHGVFKHLRRSTGQVPGVHVRLWA